MPEYYVDQEDASEMARLLKQSRFLIQAFGGWLQDHPGFEGIHRILDIGCGPGEWAAGIARTHPAIKVTGMDISQRMITFAQARVHRDRLENMSFEVGDATQFPLPYADQSFDLINACLIYAFMSRQSWPKLIEECYRLLRPGGYLRIIQEDANVSTNSPGLDEYHRRGALALYKAGQGFYPHRLGVIPRLPGMFERAGFEHLSQRHYVVNISHGTEGHQVSYEDYKILLALLQPFLVKWQVATEKEADHIYQQAMQEMLEGIPMADTSVDRFVGFWHFSSVFGQKSW
jgi:ubiquinone/menaquinone biosynthesis C-methylase UbiE